MNKFFTRVGMIILICVSFIYTEQAAKLLKNSDEIMIRIKEENKSYKQDPINAVIFENTIIPGVKGVVIDEEASYKKLKKIGKYDSNLLEYKAIAPVVSIKNNYNKYIVGGNKLKKSVSLIFLVNSNTDINKVLKIVNEKKVKANFFIDSIWLENNNELMLELMNQGHNIGNLSYKQDYNHSDFVWINTIVKKIGKQNHGFCYVESENEEILDICAVNKNYTIKPNLIVSKYPSIEIKEKLISGSLIVMPINNLVEKELQWVIDYINSKGYEIVNLIELLKE